MPAWVFNPFLHEYSFTLGRVVQSVTCLTAEACLTVDHEFDHEFDPAQSHIFVDNDHEIISTVILLPLAD